MINVFFYCQNTLFQKKIFKLSFIVSLLLFESIGNNIIVIFALFSLLFACHVFVHICRTDSEIFEDAVELQQFFIKIRDELCKNGEILLSSSLNYTLKHLHSDVEQEKREKTPKEMEEDKQKTEEEENKGVSACGSVSWIVSKC